MTNASNPEFVRTQPANMRRDQTGTELTPNREGITPAHAKARRAVRMADGRTGRLVHVAPYGVMAKLLLPGGSYVTARTETLELLDV